MKINNASNEQSLRVGIVGLGFVGDAIQNALAPHVSLYCVDPRFEHTLPLREVAAQVSLIFVCVPTPPKVNGEADTSIVASVIREIAETADRQNPPGVLVKSTIPPNTLDRLQAIHPFLPLIANPEFLREKSAIEDFRSSKRVLLGVTTVSNLHPRLTQAQALYADALPDAEIITTTAKLVALAKYATNALLATRVAFANQLYELALRLDISYPELLQVLTKDDRISPSHMQVPGPDSHRGFGGSCFPKDTQALIVLARAADVPMTILEEAVAFNTTIRDADTPRSKKSCAS